MAEDKEKPDGAAQDRNLVALVAAVMAVILLFFAVTAPHQPKYGIRPAYDDPVPSAPPANAR